jgi:predicted small secreted protein
MIRKTVLLSALIIFVISITGCNTVYRASKGAAEGAKQDVEEAKKADAWMQKNLW